ncbi:unnamed protein product [Chironomus riparius]|uniref:DNA/RNA non-specific endonuclease/pyrophosphatase/phosphodiesterase domain-containing protein n=1 Tax=Chironomus riparius TaxID=315576 RepID=A0A9N9RNA9_9DIPT|nr:unnamed protein product [Chironomus riparius]
MNKLLVTLSVLLIFFKNSEQASSFSESSTESDENGINNFEDSRLYNLRYFMNLKKLNLRSNNLIEASPCILNVQKVHMLNEQKGQEKWPLVLEPTDQPKFITVDKNGDIFVKSGEKLRLVCSGSRNRFVNVRAQVPDITVTCQRGKFFDYMGTTVNFENFGCATIPDSEDMIVEDGHHQIGFRMPNGQFLPLIDIHYDNRVEVIHVAHKLPYIDSRSHQKVSRIAFKDGKHPLGPGVSRFYQRSDIYNKMVKLLGQENARKYFNEGSFITKGHMAPKADFIFAAQQLATFFYMNINPQFSGSNNINWNFLEMSIRGHDFGGDVTIHTGGSRLLELPSKISSKNETIYLASDDKLPIPEIIWKIIEVGTDKHFSFIGFNYPSIRTKEFDQQLNICNDLCDTNEYSWLNEDLRDEEIRRDPTKGLLLCCSFEEVEKIINKGRI